MICHHSFQNHEEEFEEYMNEQTKLLQYLKAVRNFFLKHIRLEDKNYGNSSEI